MNELGEAPQHQTVLYGPETPQEELAATTLRHKINHPFTNAKVYKLEQRKPIRTIKIDEDLGEVALAAERVIKA